MKLNLKKITIFTLIFSIIPFANAQEKTDKSPNKDEKVISTPANNADETGEINVKNAEIAAILRIFSRKTGRNFILDERVKGKVTMYLPGKLTSVESLKILDSVLALKGFTTVPISENLWKVIPSKEAKQSTIPTVEGDEPVTAGAVVTKLINLKYVGAEEVQPLIQQLVSSDGLVSSYSASNSVVIIDYENNIERLSKIVASLDIPFANREMAIIPVQNADAKDIAEKLSELLGTGSDKKTGEDSGLDLVRARMRDMANNPRATNLVAAQNQQMNNAPAQTQNATSTTSRSKDPKIIADERTNSIVVVADEDMIARVKALISQLDSKVDLSGNRFYVYRCQHANAEELADVLAGLTGQSSSSSTGLSGSNSTRSSFNEDGIDMNGSRSSTSGRDRSFGRTQNRLGNTSRTPGRSRSESGAGNTGSKTIQFGEDIAITADPATNSLIINASKQDYEKIKKLLEDLDIKRRQVLVEATLLEVGVDDNVTLGTDWLTSTGGKDGGVLAQSNFGGSEGLSGLLTNPTQLQAFSVAAASAGSLTIGDLTLPSQAVLLTAARQNSNVNILSAPTLLTTDNEEAEIVVGQNVPFLASQSTSETNLNNTFNQIDRQDVGITLRLTPQISSKDFVTLKIFTDVSAVIPTATSELGPTTTVRSSETTVIAKDGQMIVIGGLISDESNDSMSGVPFLSDVPIFGSLFKRTTGSHNRRNLLTFITPRIIKDQYDIRDSTIENRNKIEQEIYSEGIEPSRREILRDPNMDKVTELKDYNGEKPGTILAPDKNIESSVLNNDKSISLKVSPKIPSAALRDQPKIEIGDLYYVMDIISGDTENADTPFTINNGETFGIIIPNNSAKESKEFFQLGKIYRFGDLTFKPVEKYISSGDSAPTSKLNSKSWYPLSSYEILNLGKGPWLK